MFEVCPTRRTNDARIYLPTMTGQTHFRDATIIDLLDGSCTIWSLNKCTNPTLIKARLPDPRTDSHPEQNTVITTRGARSRELPFDSHHREPSCSPLCVACVDFPWSGVYDQAASRLVTCVQNQISTYRHKEDRQANCLPGV